MASAYLERTFTAGNRKTYTISAWVKRANFTSSFQAVVIAGAGDDGIFFDGNSRLDCYFNGGRKQTNAVYKDTSAWYHIVAAVDTTNSTASDRIKLWVNGEQVTSFSTSTNPSADAENHFNNATKTNRIGNHTSQSYHFDGSMAHVHLVDGTAYAASDFGETDTDTGIWKPKTSPSVTYGTNGFFLKFQNTSDYGEDSSGNDNDFTVNNTITQTIDTPSNVFATFLPIPRIASGSPVHPTFSNGHTTAYFDSSGYNENAISSLAMNSGKYYWEVKCTNISSGNDGSGYVGIVDLASYDHGFIGNQCVAYRDNGQKINDNTSTSYGNTYSSGDIIGVAFDASTGTIWFSKNGTWQNSATKSEIEAGTTTNSAYTGLSTSTDWHTLVSNYSNRYASINFGNGYFGTTAVSSAGTNAGIGTFEYDVPSGYKALCTKNINAEEYS